MNKKWIIFFTAIFLITLVLVFFQSIMKNEQAYEDIDLIEYEEKLNERQSFFLYVYSTECSTCEAFSPILNETITEINVKVFALDVSKEKNYNKSFFNKQEIKLTPTLLYYKNGKEQNRVIGKVSKTDLITFFKSKETYDKH